MIWNSLLQKLSFDLGFVIPRSKSTEVTQSILNKSRKQISVIFNALEDSFTIPFPIQGIYLIYQINCLTYTKIIHMEFASPNEIVIYAIELAIKSYRKFAQKNIQSLVNDITLDQALLLILLKKDPSLNQMQLSEILFKDYAATTRMIDLLVKKSYINRNVHQEDGRRKALSISQKGIETIETLKPIIINNRKTALRGLSEKEIETLDILLKKITLNCN